MRDFDPTPPTNEPDDFDAFLQETTAEAQTQEEATLQLLKLSLRINDAIKQHGIVTFVDASGSPCDENVEIARQVIIDSGEPDAIHIANLVIGQQSMREHTLFTQIIMHMLAQESIGNTPTTEQLATQNQEKNQLIADWLLIMELDTDSEWVAFLNDVVPGDTASQRDIEVAMIAIIDQRDQAEEQKRRLELARTFARHAAGIEDTLKQHPEHEFSLFLLTLPSIQEERAANFDAKIDEQARTIGISPDQVRAYIETFRAHYTEADE